ncbi:MAG: ABC transporter permease subunit [Sphingomonas sp.]
MVLTLPVAFAIAWLLARVRFPGKVLVDALVHLPLVVPPVVTGWLLLLRLRARRPRRRPARALVRRHRAVPLDGRGDRAGVMALPLMVRAMRLSIEAVDRRLEQAAATLGAAPARVFWSITLPLSLPGVIAGAVLGFARALGEFGATISFVSNVPGETETLPLAIYAALQMPGGEATVLRLAAVSVLLSLAALVASELVARRAGRGVNVL